MNLEYSYNAAWSFEHWVETSFSQMNEPFNTIMDINQWISELCGPVGEQWGYDRRTEDNVPAGLTNSNPVKTRLLTRRIYYSWRFKHKDDAALFKLTWSGR